MKGLRWWMAILIVWLFVFYNIERLNVPIEITFAAYLAAPVIVVVVFIVPSLRNTRYRLLLAVSIPAFLMLKVWLGAPVWNGAIAATVTEICALGFTAFLARRVGVGLNEFENAVARLRFGQVEATAEGSKAGQAEIYREVRRARIFQRPLTLMAIDVEEASSQIALDRIVQEVQLTLLKQYVMSDVSQALRNELDDYNIVAQTNSHFLVVLPEASKEQAQDLAGRLRKAVAQNVGVSLRIGAASLAADAVTFDGLVQKAVAGMKSDNEQVLPSQPVTTESML